MFIYSATDARYHVDTCRVRFAKVVGATSSDGFLLIILIIVIIIIIIMSGIKVMLNGDASHESVLERKVNTVVWT